MPSEQGASFKQLRQQTCKSPSRTQAIILKETCKPRILIGPSCNWQQPTRMCDIRPPILQLIALSRHRTSLRAAAWGTLHVEVQNPKVGLLHGSVSRVCKWHAAASAKCLSAPPSGWHATGAGHIGIVQLQLNTGIIFGLLRGT